jgi:hypothetical protein
MKFCEGIFSIDPRVDQGEMRRTPPRIPCKKSAAYLNLSSTAFA